MLFYFCSLREQCETGLEKKVIDKIHIIIVIIIIIIIIIIIKVSSLIAVRPALLLETGSSHDRNIYT